LPGHPDRLALQEQQEPTELRERLAIPAIPATPVLTATMALTVAVEPQELQARLEIMETKATQVKPAVTPLWLCPPKTKQSGITKVWLKVTA
jgi:hypothetical protein